MIILIIDPSGTGTTGILIVIVTNNKIVSYEFLSFQSKEWKEHFEYLVDLVRNKKPNVIIYEETTYIHNRVIQHQGTGGLYKLIGSIFGLKYSFDFIKKIDGVAVNTVKGFKKKLFNRTEAIENLECLEGRGKGWMYNGKRINLHQLDALIIYHLWSGQSLEKKSIVIEKIKQLKTKKRLGSKQQIELERLERVLV